jgi:putative spermidine/putrescine transport system substrate-binding protein
MGGDESNIQPGLPMLKAIAKNAGSVYTSMAQLQQQIVQGEVTAAPFYSSQVQTLRRGGETAIDITLPKEGGLLLSYLLCLPKGAENRAAALQFMNDAIAPEKQIDAARDGYLPLTADAKLPDDVVKMVGMTMDEVRQRNFAPNWFIVGTNLDSRLKLVEKTLSE